MRREIMLLLAVLAYQPAFASGGVHCSADADGVAFDVEGGVSRGMGAALFSFEGKLEIADMPVASDLARMAFAREHVAQYWLDGEDLRLLLYREREGDKPHGHVELTIETKTPPGGDGEGTYEGEYRLAVYDLGQQATGEGETATFAGKVSCFAE